ncbi:hypothetical protein KBD75_00235 [Candidatus Woesebacteria bacterium]|nr:hypothetical protein [Candidatus Woesebacteria bacterium]
MNFTLIVQKNGKTIHRSWTTKIRRIIKSLRGIKWEDGGVLASLTVRYGYCVDVWGESVMFLNEGVYENKDRLWKDFYAFTEKGVH